MNRILIGRLASCSKSNLDSLGQKRHYLRLPRDRKIRGIYKSDGERTNSGDVLLRQWRLNFHPGLNVVAKQEGMDLVLRAMVSGKVVVSREECHLDFEDPLIERRYGFKRDLPIHKVTFNVIQEKITPTFKLIEAN